MALMEAMSEKSTSSQRRTGHSGRKRQCQLHSSVASSIDTTSAAETETDGASNPAPAGEAAERDTSPLQLSCTQLCVQTWRPIQRNPHHQHQPRPRGTRLTMVRRTRDGGRLRGSAMGKGRRRKGWNGRRECPSWADKARGRVSM